ncbi:MAG: flagellar M-ring protein FliF [Verrucomicrobia bacterium]|nr:flagellar M-ring protein FliF [Verrucomicrobiota bacterium]
MNFNSSTLASQLLQVWKQLGVNQRVSVVMATLLVLGGLISLGFWSSRTQYALLYGHIPEAEAAKVIAALDDAKVPYRVSGGSIHVPSEKVHTMRMQLAGRGIPRGEGVGFEIFDKPNFGISDFVQRANYIRAVQGELARTIGQLDEIESARVMIVMPENRLILDKDKHPTASVFVRVRGNSQLPPQAINSIRFLVANAVEGLKPHFVSIVDNLGNTLSENSENDSLVGLSSTQLAARQNLEKHLSRNAETMLEKVLGPGQAIVRVAAEINFDTTTTTQEKFDPDGQVLRTQTKNEENDDTTTSTPSVPAGVSSNLPDETNHAASAMGAPVTSVRNKKNTATTEYEVSRTVSNIIQAAGGLRRLSAAVTIAARMDGTGAERKAVPRTPEELEKLRRIVQGALGIQVGDSTRNDQITLEELPFNDQFATAINQQLDQQQRHLYWWELGQKLIYPVLGVVVLFVFFRLFKRTAPEEIPIGISLRQISGGSTNGHGNGNGHNFPAWQREADPSVVSVEVLNQLIKENPGNMTQAIRGWLARGKATTK